MLRTKKIILAAMVMMMSLAIFTGCKREEDKTKYLHLKADIVGAWCDEAGPEEVETDRGTAHMFYEFTEDGNVFYYSAFDFGAIYYSGSYSIDGNIFDSEGSKCRINVENDILTMTYDSGSSRYRRVGAAELLEYSVYAHGEALFAEQEPLIMAGQGGSNELFGIGENSDTEAESGGVADVADTADTTDTAAE